MFQQILQSLAVKVLVAIINFSILIISSKYLGVSSRGEISIFILNLSIIQGINDVFTGYSIIHFVPKFNFRKILVSGLIYTGICCALCNLLVTVLKKQISGYEWLAYIISLLVILNTFNSMLLLGKQEIRLFNILAFLQPLILLIGILLSVFCFKIYTIECFLWPLLWAFSISFLISTTLLYKVLKKQPSNQIDFDLKEIVLNGFFYQASILMFIFCNRYSYYLLLDNKKVGLYASACMLMESVLLVVNSIAPILISKIANQRSVKYSANMALSFAKLSFITSCITVIIVLMVPESMIIFFLGKGFIGIKTLMVVYSPGILLLSFFTTINNYFSGIGKQKYILMAFSIGFVVSIVIAPFLINRFDMLGAALTANLSYLSIFIVVLIVFFVQSDIKWLDLFKVRKEITFFTKLVKKEI